MRRIALGLLAAAALAGVAHATGTGVIAPHGPSGPPCPPPPKQVCTIVNGKQVCKPAPKPKPGAKCGVAGGG